MTHKPHLTARTRRAARLLLCTTLIMAEAMPLSAETISACSELAAKIRAATGGMQKNATDNAVTFDMNLPRTTLHGNEMQVVCPAYAKSASGFSLVATWGEGSDPSEAFFQQIGGAGAALTGEAAAKIQKAARSCQSEATRAQTSTAETEAGKAFLNCQSFARLGGATTITIYHSLPANTAR